MLSSTKSRFAEKLLLHTLFFFLLTTQICIAQSQWGNAVRFAGTNGYIMVPDNPSLQIGDAVSMAAHVKRTRLDNIDFILEKGGDWNYGETNYGMSLHGNYNNHMFYFLFDGGWRGTSGVADTNWHHYAIVAINGDQNPTFYIDGEVKVTEFSEGGSVINMNYTTLRNLNIGAQIEAGATYYSTIIIDELSVWNVALDSFQIRSMMMDTLGSAYYSTVDSGLVGYWRFDTFEDLGINGDGSDDVRDLSQSSAHGDAVGELALVPSDPITEIGYYTNEMLKGFQLRQNYPNPFNPTTKITWQLSEASNVTLKILNALGEEVATQVNNVYQNAGEHSSIFIVNSSLTSGVYFYQLRAGSYVATKKMLLLK
jgi:hypothetical protein